jgi:hypothetical protein
VLFLYIFFFFVFSSTKSENRREKQVLPKGMGLVPEEGRMRWGKDVGG